MALIFHRSVIKYCTAALRGSISTIISFFSSTRPKCSPHVSEKGEYLHRVMSTASPRHVVAMLFLQHERLKQWAALACACRIMRVGRARAALRRGIQALLLLDIIDSLRREIVTNISAYARLSTTSMTFCSPSPLSTMRAISRLFVPLNDQSMKKMKAHRAKSVET